MNIPGCAECLSTLRLWSDWSLLARKNLKGFSTIFCRGTPKKMDIVVKCVKSKQFD